MAGPSSMTYGRARSLLLFSGLILVGLIALTMVIRGVDPVEIGATLLFAPVFAALLFVGWKGGAAAGAVAAAAYVLMRIPAIGLVGLPVLGGLILWRVTAFLVFGLAGGWASERLQASLDKLELYDEIDDETGLGNARSVVNAVDTERSRAARYHSVFSVVLASFPADRRGRTQLRSLGSRLSASLRDSDHAAHVRDGEEHLIALVLPQTGREGAETVAGNLRRRLNLDGDPGVEAAAFTFPGDEEQVEHLVERFRRLLA